MENVCALCTEYAVLRNSHVLPAFIFRWLKNRSGYDGHIRCSDNPNLRIQDGPKFPWLCEKCEQLFSKYEDLFFTNFFSKFKSGEWPSAYEDWMLKFCVSISWRVLSYAKGMNKNTIYTEQEELLVRQAKEKWKRFLFGEVPHPGYFEQHVLVMGNSEISKPSSYPDNFNRFMSGAVTLDIIRYHNSLFTFAKLGPVCIFGKIQSDSRRWEGTRIGVKRGVFAKKLILPVEILEYLKDKARHQSMSMENMSTTQKLKIQDKIQNNIDIFASSEQFRSMVADADTFGIESIICKT